MLNLTNVMVLKLGSDGLKWGWDARSITQAQILTYSSWGGRCTQVSRDGIFSQSSWSSSDKMLHYFSSRSGNISDSGVESVGAWHPVIQKEERKGDSCNPGKLQGKCHHVQRQTIIFLWAEHRHWSQRFSRFYKYYPTPPQLYYFYIQFKN